MSSNDTGTQKGAEADRDAQARDLDAVDAYDYELPEELIAAHPADRRGESRLLVARRDSAQIEHVQFSDLPDYLEPSDLLVFNNTRVIPARIMAKKETGGAVEMLVLDIIEPGGEDRWTEEAGGTVVFRCMTRSSRALRPGMELTADAGDAGPFVVREWEAGKAEVEVDWDGAPVDLLEEVGQMPLPPYILKRRKTLGEAEEATADDRKRYQTVYAAKPGAVAAPTAGLHFSEELLERLEERGIRRAFVTLQVGIGTFRPVSADRLSEHEMHSEEYEISAELARAIEETREAGGRIIAVGTTSMRALEAEARRDKPFEPGVRRTDIFLHPGVDFEVCDGLVTNFHLPRSTLLALVAGLAGYDFMRQIYAEAIEERYRFYSYGDGMLIL
ncbi:tRNA preQ1(34) S-adenosylmethionine ribosyltransferase-isomerase QueA [Persicimonas caeni]|uniref:S-adenosylmethionine:tRNA ribosyltransferase-isomerase n=1 Tax=Persicimonas caeni TaxID=2292766 RepID=A0A4Y6Q1V1_PERCE|nr:tRNA preQ1(34) S-adenosylmethionine ribosyltransferase-isomerase QueA [Persicimonas caeni]QDG54533.1 tRNA preQ1(34) S-adenosylmethionine ribosyltransferase-isomerase QueA [Persicimonas caeni]QED35754.1 tRNA preQ1(34) S-adenosylmethionine ribosyltransferase-isomerase QueA [Persicimonas caeni]